MSSSTTESKATFGQATRILGLFNEAGANRKNIQGLVENGDLLALMLECPSLSLVKRKAFEKLLSPWTPVEEYTNLIMSRSKSRNWRITSRQINKLTNELQNHSGLLKPTGVDIRIGDYNFAGNYVEAFSWLMEEIGKLDHALQSSVRSTLLYPQKVANPRKQNTLIAVKLDIGKYWNSKDNGINLNDTLSSTDDWPGLATIWTLALNPQVCVLIGSTLPQLYLAGLNIKSEVKNIPLLWASGNKELSLVSRATETVIPNSTIVAYQHQQ
jgi:hypothetical protein